MSGIHRTAYATPGTAVLSLTLGALPGAAHAAARDHGPRRAAETSLTRQG